MTVIRGFDVAIVLTPLVQSLQSTLCGASPQQILHHLIIDLRLACCALAQAQSNNEKQCVSVKVEECKSGRVEEGEPKKVEKCKRQSTV